MSGFCERVRRSTAAAHDAAEHQRFIHALLSGGLDVRSVVLLLESLLPVYAELEAQLTAQREDATVGLFDHRALDRAPRLRADLARLGRRDPRPAPTPAVRAYVDIVRESATTPPRLLAHHYTRYLGDLAGGQAISRLVQRHYGLSPEQLTSYDFSDLGDTVHYRKQYRALLDLLPWSPTEQAEFIAECALAFEASARLFAELGARSGCTPPAQPSARTFLAAEQGHLARRVTHPVQ